MRRGESSPTTVIRTGEARPPAPGLPDGVTSVIRHGSPREGRGGAPAARRPGDGAGKGVAPGAPAGAPRRPADSDVRPTTRVRPGPQAGGPRRDSATTWMRFDTPQAPVSPVFVDGSGRRRTLWRVVGVLVAVLCLAVLVVLLVAATGGSPDLTPTAVGWVPRIAALVGP